MDLKKIEKSLNGIKNEKLDCLQMALVNQLTHLISYSTRLDMSSVESDERHDVEKVIGMVWNRLGRKTKVNSLSGKLEESIGDEFTLKVKKVR